MGMVVAMLWLRLHHHERNRYPDMDCCFEQEKEVTKQRMTPNKQSDCIEWFIELIR